MDGVNEADLTVFEAHDQRVSSDAIAEETHATEQIAVRYATAGENDLFAGGEVLGLVNAFGVADAHFCQAFLVLGFRDNQASLNFAV
jgi:hypothetical protein